ncbi:MAG: DUF5693 family protein [Candidatus Bipolaricaulota bacterium]|nr:DUF5693 family protein [Candidatus Bipolaricaulota bacterium]
MGLIALALVAALGVGYQRSVWESSYTKLVIAVPYQELTRVVYDEGGSLWHERLEHLRALGVSALTLELSDLPDWGLRAVPIDQYLPSALAQAQRWGFEIGFVAEMDDGEIIERVRAFAEAVGIQPSWLMPIDLPPLGSSLSLREQVQNESLMWAVLEFAEPLTLDELNPKRVVRAHAIKSKELDRLGLVSALERWERAVQERNIRLLWVTEHERFTRYLEHLRARLSDLGFQNDTALAALTLERFESSFALYLAIALGLTALLVLLAQELWPAWSRSLVLGGSLWVGWAFLGFWDLSWAREALALAIAIVAPWALIFLFKERLGGWKFLIAVSLGSVGAGLAIAALLSDAAYFLKLQEFRGVKIALILPVLLVVATELWLRRGERWFTARSAWVATAAGAGLLFLILERSGNLPVVPVARWEELLRERLENLFVARPRFKEFLIGHPALVLWDRQHSSRFVALILLALGAVGQTSMINSFAHLHTPLWLSLWRTLNGLILGVLIGLALSMLWKGWHAWRRRSS